MFPCCCCHTGALGVCSHHHVVALWPHGHGGAGELCVVIVMQWLWACVVVVAQGKVCALSAQWTCALVALPCVHGRRLAGALGKCGHCRMCVILACMVCHASACIRGERPWLSTDSLSWVRHAAAFDEYSHGYRAKEEFSR